MVCRKNGGNMDDGAAGWLVLKDIDVGITREAGEAYLSQRRGEPQRVYFDRIYMIIGIIVF